MNPKALYVTKISLINPDRFGGFAIGLQEWPTGQSEPGEVCIAFHDTVRGHEFSGKLKEDRDGTITLTQKDGHFFVFKPCTIEMFRRTYYKLAHNGEAIAEVCHTTDDLWEYYRRRLTEDFL